jgi:uncharacterized protein with PQ loop repeat
MNIKAIADYISLVGTCCGLFSRVPQVHQTYKTRSAKDLSSKTMGINIFANSCFLFYMIVNENYFIMINCISVIILEGSLVIMKGKFGEMKKTASQTSLVDMVPSDSEF